MNYDINININDLRFDQRDVGMFVKESKTVYVWEFMLNNKMYKVELEHSKITGKRKVLLNGKVLVQRMLYTYNFMFSFHIDKHYLTIVQLSPVNYDLRIDNLCFKGLIYNMYRQREANQRNDDTFFASNNENTVEFIDNTAPQQQHHQQQVDINDFEFCN